MSLTVVRGNLISSLHIPILNAANFTGEGLDSINNILFKLDSFLFIFNASSNLFSCQKLWSCEISFGATLAVTEITIGYSIY